MNTGIFRRLYRMRKISSLVLCLPGILLGLWYAWSAFAQFDQYRRSVGKDVDLTLDGFQLQLFDVLRKDLRRMVLGPAPESSGFEHLALHVDTENLRALFEGAAMESARPYVAAELEPGNLRKSETLIPVKIRLRGQKHWHLLGKQKSIKVKLPKGRLHKGHRVFNLINDPDPMVVGEQVILDLLRGHGVLTPSADFARLRVNTTDLGVFRYVTQPDEGVLRNSRRMPGNIYSGNLPPSVATEDLWKDASRWKKVASRNGSKEEKKNRADIERLLHMIGSATIAEFADFVRHEVDIRAFAAFDALDVAFACNQHDFRENHKLYFDPYRGRWEPIAWNFRGFHGDSSFNVVENPLLLRLKMVPEYLALRNNILYDFLTGDGSPSAIRARGVKLFKKLASELATDPYWDAYHLLSNIDRFHRQLVRPMDLERALLVFESRMATYGRRHAFLVRELENNPLRIHASKKEGDGATGMQVVIDGRVGVRLAAFRVQWPAGCKPEGWQVFRDGKPVTVRSSDDVAELIQPETLLPTIRIAGREKPGPSVGNVVSEMAAVSYPYTLESSCRPESIAAEGTHLATHSRVQSREASPGLLAGLQGNNLTAVDQPRFLPGEIGPRSRTLPPRSETVTLGPGTIIVRETRIFSENQTVRIAPGTTILMGRGASLVFLGRVHAEGSRTAPVVIRRGENAAWGGIAVHGPGSKGSTLDYTAVSGGTTPKWRLTTYPGMVNFHDTGNISLRNCSFSGNEGSGDMIHAAYVDGFGIEDTTVRDAASDALDFEFTRGTLRRVEVASAGDDGLDLMGAEVELSDSVISDCKGNGVSGGEESAVTIRNALIASCKVGVLVKNAAGAYLFNSLLFRNGTGVEVYRRTVRFDGASTIAADVLFVVDSDDKPLSRKDRKRDILDNGRIQTQLPQSQMLSSLREDVLGLEEWEDLPAWLSDRRGEVPR